MSFENVYYRGEGTVNTYGLLIRMEREGKSGRRKISSFPLYPQVYVTNRTGMVLGTPTGGGMSQGRLRPEDS